MRPDGQKTPFFKSFTYACKGIASAYRTGRNIRVQSLVAVAVSIAGFAFSLAPWEWCAVLLCCGLVIGAECMNSALEDIVDMAQPNINPLAGRAKDMAAGAVWVFALTSVVVGLIVFVPHLLALLR